MVCSLVKAQMEILCHLIVHALRIRTVNRHRTEQSTGHAMRMSFGQLSERLLIAISATIWCSFHRGRAEADSAQFRGKILGKWAAQV